MSYFLEFLSRIKPSTVDEDGAVKPLHVKSKRISIFRRLAVYCLPQWCGGAPHAEKPAMDKIFPSDTLSNLGAKIRDTRASTFASFQNLLKPAEKIVDNPGPDGASIKDIVEGKVAPRYLSRERQLHKDAKVLTQTCFQPVTCRIIVCRRVQAPLHIYNSFNLDHDNVSAFKH